MRCVSTSKWNILEDVKRGRPLPQCGEPSRRTSLYRWRFRCLHSRSYFSLAKIGVPDETESSFDSVHDFKSEPLSMSSHLPIKRTKLLSTEQNAVMRNDCTIKKCLWQRSSIADIFLVSFVYPVMTQNAISKLYCSVMNYLARRCQARIFF